MNILVLGNGFDIAHDLQTQYRDFLNYVELTHDILAIKIPERQSAWEECKKCKECKIPQALKDNLDIWVYDKRSGMKRDGLIDKQRDFHQYWGNFWFQLFKDKPSGTWIDFEKDIKEACLTIENSMYNKGEIKAYDDVYDMNSDFAKFKKYIKEENGLMTYKQLIDLLYKDLYELVNAFDIYINYFINEEAINTVSCDIVSLNIDKVISFNYSNTYERHYDYYKDVEYDYIHGKAGQNINKVFSNLVLGYDENDNNINEKLVTIFASFKKYYQRVLMETGNKYSRWVKEIHDDLEKEENQNDPKKIHNVHFFGHSMDITDKDIIKALILNKNVKTTIYYYSREAKVAIVKNLIPVLGYNNFLEYTNNGKIKLVFQGQIIRIYYSDRYKSLKAVKNLYQLPYITVDEYKGLDDWVNAHIGDGKYNYKEELVYYYLAIDALQKWNIEDDKVQRLKSLSENYQGTPCSFDAFLKEYTLICGTTAKFDNTELQILIETNYQNRTDSKKLRYERLMRNICINGQTYQHYKMVNGYLNLTTERLDLVKVNFLKRFEEPKDSKFVEACEKSLSHSEIYEEMVEFLLLIPKDLVEKLFSSVLDNQSETNINNDRMKILLKQYNTALKAKDAAINGKSDVEDIFKGIV